MRFICYYLKKHPWLCLGDVLCVFGFILTELGLPALFAQMVNKGVMAHNTQKVLMFTVFMIGIAIVGTLMNMGLSAFASQITTTIVREIREDLFAIVESYTHETYEEIGVSSLITRLTNDAYQIMMFLNTILRMGIVAPLMFVSSMWMIFEASGQLSLVILIALPLLLIFVMIIGKVSRPMSERQQKNLDGINRILRENLSGTRVIRAFNRESFMEERFDEVNTNYQKSSRRLFLLMSLNQPMFMLLFSGVLACVLWFGAKQISIGQLQVGNYMAVVEYIFHALYSTLLFATIFIMYPRANVSAMRIKEAMQKPIKMQEGTLTEIKGEGVLRFDDVTFTYPNDDKSTLEHLSFEAHPGEMVAFVGGTGSGKSSLIQLIPRFYDVDSGHIYLDNHDIKEFKIEALRHMLGYVPQKATLFNGTIASNLRFGDGKATDEALWEALDIAQARTFVEEKNGQLEEPVTEGGTNFSGGQRQRLAIARALVRQPKVYLFDDSFSALDFKTDAALRLALKSKVKDGIMLVVAQRISTVMEADRIIVLDEGRIVDQGKHEELMKRCQIYQEIAASQLTEEELA